jgi:hypothetical protein
MIASFIFLPLAYMEENPTDGLLSCLLKAILQLPEAEAARKVTQ